MKQIVIEINDEVYEGVTGDTTFRDDERKALNAIRNGTVLPENPTNGDIWLKIYGGGVIAITNGKVYAERAYFPFDEEWWNTPYKVKG